jgi:hypothetical protein
MIQMCAMLAISSCSCWLIRYTKAPAFITSSSSSATCQTYPVVRHQRKYSLRPQSRNSVQSAFPVAESVQRLSAVLSVELQSTDHVSVAVSAHQTRRLPFRSLRTSEEPGLERIKKPLATDPEAVPSSLFEPTAHPTSTLASVPTPMLLTIDSVTQPSLLLSLQAKMMGRSIPNNLKELNQWLIRWPRGYRSCRIRTILICMAAGHSTWMVR